MKSYNSILTLILAGLSLATSAHASTIFNDTFTDGGRTDGVDAQDIPWYQVASNTLSVSSGQLAVDVTGQFHRLAGNFGSVTIGVGQTLEWSFNMRFTADPAAGGSVMRFGIYNDGGSALTGDGANTNNDFGYGFNTNPGAALSNGTVVTSEVAGDPILSGSPGPGAVSGGTTGASIDWNTTSHSVLFSLTRLNNGTLDLFASIDGNAAASGNIAAINNNYTFNYVAFGQGAYNRDYAIDNVNLTLVPEPSAILLSGFSTVLFLLRRRKG